MKHFRWGILGAANIARKNWKAIAHSAGNVVAGVAARDRGRAEQFVRECQALHPFTEVPRVFDDYDAMLASPEIDAVYVPLPTGLRKEWVLRAAAAGKHVLCEKPCAVNASDLREMLAACAKHGVQFMDGVMFMHSPRLAAVRAMLDDPARVGAVRRITSMFSFAADEARFARDIRIQADLEPAGCLGDLGWYCLRFSLFAQRWQLPVSVTGRVLATAPDGRTPTQFSGELLFADGASAGFYCSFVTELQQWAMVSGDKGTLRVPGFVHPDNSYEPAFEINGITHAVPAAPGTRIPTHVPSLGEFGHATAQDTRMWDAFSTQVRSGKLNPEWPDIALKTQLIMDACLASARADSRLVPVG